MKYDEIITMIGCVNIGPTIYVEDTCMMFSEERTYIYIHDGMLNFQYIMNMDVAVIINHWLSKWISTP